MVQRGHNYAIVDEVDSILVDEARTPLIISGPLEDRSEMYNTIDAFIVQLLPEDYEIDEKQRTAIFTEEGTEKLENLLREAGHLKGESLYDVENVAIVHHVNNALKAHRLFQKDKDYIVRNGEIVIIDEFTGRMMPGRRYSEGLHQALEAKEHVAIQPENQTLASVTFQNYFRMYEKLAGMTGTALDRGRGVRQHLRSRRDRGPDQPAGHPHRRGRRGLPDGRGEIQGDRPGDPRGPRQGPADPGRHHLDREIRAAGRAPAQGRLQGLRGAQRPPPRAGGGDIVAQAGRPGAITIATNMAGRGTDIQLGGNADMRIATSSPTCRPARSATRRRRRSARTCSG